MEAGSTIPQFGGDAISGGVSASSNGHFHLTIPESETSDIVGIAIYTERSRTAANGNIINRRVLILNQNYEPLSVCTVRRALVLAFRGAAEIVEEHSFLRVKSIRAAYPVPSVVRLDRYVNAPARNVILNRRNLLIRDGHRCMYCGVKAANLTIDHIVPRQKNGEDTWENLVCACPRCNSKKGDRTPEKAGMKLLKKPKRPHQINFIRQFAANADPSWRPYLFME